MFPKCILTAPKRGGKRGTTLTQKVEARIGLWRIGHAKRLEMWERLPRRKSRKSPSKDDENVFVLRNIFFDFDKATIRDESKPELDKLNLFLSSNPDIQVEISGHTDAKGNDTYNK